MRIHKATTTQLRASWALSALLFFALLLSALLLFAAAPSLGQLAERTEELVSTSDAVSSFPENFKAVRDRLTFLTADPLGPRVLWSTDGTFEGTRAAAVLCDGCRPERFGETPGLQYVLKRSLGQLLWRTDGTVEGTYPIELPQPDFHVWSSEGVEAAGKLVFAASTTATGTELAIYDPATDDLTLVDTLAGSQSGVSSSVLAAAGAHAFWIHQSDPLGPAVWGFNVDSAAASPRRLLDVPNGVNLHRLGSKLLLFVRDSAGDNVLWVSDGTNAGTLPLISVGNRPDAVLPGADDTFFVTNGRSNSTGVPRFWITDGTASGTRAVPTPRLTDAAGNFHRVGDTFFFTRYEGRSLRWWSVREGRAPRREAHICRDCDQRLNVWATSTHLIYGLDEVLTTITEGGDLIENHPTCFVFCSGRVIDDSFVYLSEEGQGEALAFVDESGLGRKLTNLPSTVRVYSTDVGFLGDLAIFNADAEATGAELWSSRPEETAKLVRNLKPETGDLDVDELVGLPNGTVTAVHDNALHSFDGTRWSRFGGDKTCSIARPAPILDYLDFALVVCRNGTLWSVDFDRQVAAALASGVSQVRTTFDSEARAQAMSANSPRGVVFSTFDLTNPLWISDGTPSGTHALGDGSLREVRGLAPLANEVVFVGCDKSDNCQLWKTDGTSSGTAPYTSDPGGFGGFFFGDGIRNVGDVVLLRVSDDLWMTDGTSAGTAPINLSASPAGLFDDPLVIPGALLFTGRNGQELELWRLGLASKQLTLVRSLGERFRAPGGTPTLGNQAVFATSNSNGEDFDLWATDGTAGGTIQLLQEHGPSPLSKLTTAGDRVFFTAFTPETGFELWTTDGTAQGTRLAHDILPGVRSSSPAQFEVAGEQLYFVADDGLAGREVFSLEHSAAAGSCRSSLTSLCLNNGRFRAQMDWSGFQNDRGRGNAEPLTDDTGYFWIFDENNVENVLKVLDGRGVNGSFWVFFAGLSDLQYAMTVTDAQTGRAKRYVNALSNFGSVGDTGAFEPESLLQIADVPKASSVLGQSSQATRANCNANETTLCLNGGRFAIQIEWQDFQGGVGIGNAVPLTDDTGYFWFFDEDNVEVALKVLDGRGVNGSFWVFFGALSNVEYTLTVTDTSTGARRTYFNPSGQFASVGDTKAF